MLVSRNIGLVRKAYIENVRQKFATSMALEGLIDEAVRQKLMMDEKRDWKPLNTCKKYSYRFKSTSY